MFISIAHAGAEVGSAVAETPNAADMFWTNMGLIAAMFFLFYFIMIRPQQRRLKEQRDILDSLKKGDTVVTGGGLIAKVSKVVSDTEVEIDLGGTKVMAMRYTLQTRLDDDTKLAKPSNDEKPAEKKKVSTTKKSTSKKSEAKKKA